MNKTLIEQSVEQIKRFVRSAKSPAVFTSFGKDSMVLLGLLREANLLSAVQLVTFRHPAFQNRYAFADRIINEWSLDPLIVYHGWNSILAGNGRVDLIGTAQIRGAKIHLPVANMVSDPKSEIWSCALDNQLPHAVDLIKFDFDLVLLGSKQGDVDPVVGKVAVKNVVEHSDRQASLLFPLRDWTDDDVWQFIHAKHIPYDTKRYIKSPDGMADDVAYPEHSEYLPVCTACLNPANQAEVWCPKLNKMIPSVNSGIKRQSYPPRFSKGIPEVVAF
jgi:3'-phosphoadenosine 5'-phosphosulfate sulfotransferase (PAPS reductase)/FAD synthetase